MKSSARQFSTNTCSETDITFNERTLPKDLYLTDPSSTYRNLENYGNLYESKLSRRRGKKFT